MTTAATNKNNRYALVLSRSCAALLGGYIASFVITFGMARLLVRLGIAPADAASAPAFASFLIWMCLGLYAFGARSARRAWLLPLLLIALFGAAAVLAGAPALR